LSRQLLVLVPMAYFFPLLWGIDGVWYSMPASDFTAFAFTIPILIWHIRKFKAYGQKDNH
jgi:Na+-driven multidrug efflux pump